MTLHEPAVAATDYLLSLECAAFAFLLLQAGSWRRQGSARFAAGVFFAAAAAASLVGGTVHGFFPDPDGLPNRVLWTITLLAVGLTALAAAMAALRLGLSQAAAGRIAPALVLLYLGYVAIVLFVRRDFTVAIAAYLPATLLLLGVLAAGALRRGDRASLWGVTGLLLTLVAAALQQAGVGLPALGLDHNVLYHLLQATAMYLLFRTFVTWR